MSNTYFRFKQFTIHQDRCGMKVSTDACIQGAWTPIPDGAKRVLDIGTGTGLLSLMLAQRSQDIDIDAVELDESAAGQAVENIKASEWANRINVINADIREYTTQDKYDLIICNPPFFNNSLLGTDENRNKARHSNLLSNSELIDSIDNLLEIDSMASILLPIPEFKLFENMIVEKGWYACRKLWIHPSEGKSPNRVVGLIRRGSGEAHEKHLYIRQKDRNSYTSEFENLLRYYYLII